MPVQYVSMTSFVFRGGSGLVAVAHRDGSIRNRLSMVCYIYPEIFTVSRRRSNTFRPVRTVPKTFKKSDIPTKFRLQYSNIQ